MTQKFQPDDAARFEAAMRRFDEENSQDPNSELVDGTPQPRELIYARWLSDWVLRICPTASEALRLAARCQHIRRWTIPRNQYPMTRAGYLQWREALKQFHAETAGTILKSVGYPDDVIRRVQDLNLKKNFPADPESRVLEDALCLVFLERQLADFATKSTEEKVISALQKSWKKMTPVARDLALSLPYGPNEKRLRELALKSVG